MKEDSVEEIGRIPLNEAFEDEVLTMHKKIGGITVIGSPEKVQNLTEEDLTEMVKFENLPPRIQVLFDAK
jgi:hypothetical protein